MHKGRLVSVKIAALDPGSEETFERFRENPLWQRLGAVKNDRVYTVPSGYWIFGNVLAAGTILDELFEYLVEGENTT